MNEHPEPAPIVCDVDRTTTVQGSLNYGAVGSGTSIDAKLHISRKTKSMELEEDAIFDIISYNSEGRRYELGQLEIPVTQLRGFVTLLEQLVEVAKGDGILPPQVDPVFDNGLEQLKAAHLSRGGINGGTANTGSAGSGAKSRRRKVKA